MTPSFDIQELRANIGSDREVECTLLSMFVESTNESLQLLAEQLPPAPDAEYNALWKTHMHQIKGAALNLGADTLRDLAFAAQEAYGAPETQKKTHLAAVTAEFRQVEEYIKTLL